MLKTNSKNLSSVDISNNEYHNFTTSVFTYNDSVIMTLLRNVRLKLYDENGNILYNQITTNNNIQIAYFDKANKHFYKISSNYNSQSVSVDIDMNNVSYFTLQPTENNRYYGFSLFN